ncbi:ABC transporter ATP-binding protein [Curtanaerobium respiraculi]|uniref:ABC transporter ATP-binding protein n=1 Tax=Curtanaerobium respiraculi TaxID=2949669 RepID=UPI0024B3A61C|nr:ABC transporter ATP-binding protein [Curtanaerobium respiraculi]
MRALKYLAPHAGVVVLILGLLLVQAFCDLMLPTLTADLVDTGIQRAVVSGSGADMGYLLAIGGKMIGVTAVGACASAVISFLASRTGAAIGRDLRGRLFATVVGFSRAEVQKFSAASLITRATNDVQQIQMISVLLMRVVLYAPILAIGGIIMVVRTQPGMGWIAVAAVVATSLVVAVLIGVAMPKFRIMQKLIDRVNLVAREILTGIPVIRAFNRQSHEQARFDEANANLRDTQLFTNRVMSLMRPLTMLVMNATSCLIVWVAAGFIGQGAMETGQMIAFITYTMVIVMGFMMLSLIMMMLPRADISAGRIDEVLGTQPSVADAPHPLAGASAADAGARIAFDGVTFRYDCGSEPALRDIGFVAEPGRTTAIIGPTGCGKSSILRLMTRSYDATEGTVSLDGEDVRDIPLDALHAQMGYVPQKAFLFAGTVRDNVAYGVPDATDEDIWKALRIAQADSFVEELGGLDAEISQGGTNVSGGQRQRLAIARAVALPARAYLFDDSFSALDYSTDAALRAALARELAGRTVVIVAQRISTIRNADTIIVLDEGRLAGKGTHAQLMETCGTYREIATSQLSPEELAAEGGA